MFRPKNQPAPTNYRLPKLQQVLKDSDLQLMLSEAGNRKGCTIEFPFISGTHTFMLTVKFVGGDSYEPIWTYYKGDNEAAQMLWQHPTGDLNLVLNLCAHETGVEGAEYTATGISHDPSRVSYTALEVEQMGGQTTTLVGPPSTVGKTATLEGDLSNMQLPTLLQSISMSKMTGCLRVTNTIGGASIWFEDGTPTHAESMEAKGDQAIVELITWEEGEFHFYPDDKAPEKTVKRRVDGLLMEGVALLDQNKYVKDQGLKPQSYLIRTQDKITEEQFKQALTKGAPLDFENQKRFYGMIDNASTLLDLLRRMPMIKNEWVPLMFNMLSCGLVKLSDVAPAGVTVAPLLAVPEYQLDRAAITGVVRSLTRQETGTYTYPAFLFLLEHEFQKSAALGIPLALVIFEAKLRVGDGIQPLPMQFIRETIKRIEMAKRTVDTLGHFETFDFGIFMPNTQTKTARVFAARLMEMLAADPFIPKPFGQLSLFFGIASAPEDTMDINVMISAARESKRRSIETGSSVTTCRELGQR